MVFAFIMILYVCVLTLIISYNGRLPKWQTKLLLTLLVFSVAAMGACIKPNPIYDLHRHFQLIDIVRRSPDSFSELMTDGLLRSGNYRYTYVFNFLVYLIAKLLPNQALPFIAIAVTYGIFVYILLSEFEKNHLTSRNILLSLAMFSILLPYLYVYSGIRNAMASAISGLGIYAFYKSKNLMAFVISLVVATLIHPASIALIPFVVLSRIKPGLKGVIAMTAFPSILFHIMEYIRLHSGSTFLFKISAKYYNYTMVRADNQGKVFLYSPIITLVVLSILALQRQKARNEAQKRSYYFLNMIIWYAMFSLGYVEDYSMAMRLPYNIAVLSPVLVNMLFKAKTEGSLEWYAIIAGKCVIYSLSVLALYENIMWL